MNILQLPVLALSEIVRHASTNAIGRLELANVCRKFERAVEHKTPRARVVENVLRDMENATVHVTRETLHRLLFKDIFDVEYRPKAMDLSIVQYDEDEDEPSVDAEVSMVPFSCLTSLILRDANLSDTLFGRIMNTSHGLRYVELIECYGDTFGPRATVTSREVPWTLRLVRMEFSLEQIRDRFRPAEGENAHLRYLVCVNCTIRRKRRSVCLDCSMRRKNNRSEDWLKIYTGKNRTRNVVRQANLVAVSDRWLRTEKLNCFEVSAGHMLQTEMMRRYDPPIVSIAALIMSLNDNPEFGKPDRLRFGIDRRDGPLDVKSNLPLERFQNLRDIEIFNTEITDEFFQLLVNACGNLTKVTLVRCKGLTFENVRITARDVKLALCLIGMRVNSVALRKAFAPHPSGDSLEYFEFTNCRFD